MIFECFDLRRCRGFLGPGLLIAGMLILINGLTIVIRGWDPATDLPLKFTESAESKARNLERLFPPTLNESGEFLLYFGASSAGEAIDAPRLATVDAYADPVCGICGIFPGFEILQRLAEPVIRRGVRPKIVLICIHAGYLAMDPSRKMKTSLSVGAILRSSLILQHIVRSRAVVGDLIRGYASRIRRSLEIAETDQTPWIPPQRMGIKKNRSSKTMDLQISAFSESGAFDSQTYVRFQEQNVDRLIQLIREFNRLGSVIKVVLMPEHSLVRDRIPESAYEYLQGRLASVLRKDVPEVWNLAGIVPDDLFADCVHVNENGRIFFSNRLAEKLHEYGLRNP